jgi:hypothetical protein
LDVVRIDHRPYLQSIIKIDTPRWSLKKHLEFELECLRMQISDLNFIFFELDSNSFDYIGPKIP